MKAIACRNVILCVAIAALPVVFGATTISAQDEPASNEEVILRALNHRVTVDVAEIPLQDLLQFLADSLPDEQRIIIMADRHAFAEKTHPLETPVTLKVKNLRMRSVLSLISDQLDCGWTIAHEVVLITSKDRAASQLFARTYDVEDLVVKEGAEEGQRTPNFDELLMALQKQVAPETWAEVGGPGSIGPYGINGFRIVVRQTPQVHYEIARLLGELRATPEIPADEPLSIAPASEAPPETPAPETAAPEAKAAEDKAPETKANH